MQLSFYRSNIGRPILKQRCVVKPRVAPILTDIVVGVIALSVIVDVAKTLNRRTPKEFIKDSEEEE